MRLFTQIVGFVNFSSHCHNLRCPQIFCGSVYYIIYLTNNSINTFYVSENLVSDNSERERDATRHYDHCEL